MMNNKKIIYYGITLFATIIILLIAYSLFFNCSVPYTVSCHYSKSPQAMFQYISCTSDKDCSVENMNSFCSPGYPNLLECDSAKYYYDNEYCKGCDCIGPSYDVNKRPDGVYEKHDGNVIVFNHKITKSFVFGSLFLIIIIVAIVGLFLCNIKKKGSIFCRLFGLISIAFLSGVVFQLFLIIILDACGIDRLLGIFMLPLLFIIPTLISIIISYFYHNNKTDIILTTLATLIFIIITLDMIAIG